MSNRGLLKSFGKLIRSGEKVKAWIEHCKDLAVEAGKAILQVRNEGVSLYNVEIKGDDSPVSRADKIAHRIIEEGLKGSPYPVVSEEEVKSHGEVSSSAFWLVDPLDGTKSFIKGGDDYTVNIALVKDRSVELGVVYVPAQGHLYWAFKGQGAYKDGTRLGGLQQKAESPVALVSRSHLDPVTEEFLKLNAISETKGFGSSLKLCLVAEGLAQVYPRFAPTREWDTAAGQILVEETGGTVLDIETRRSLFYSKGEFLNKGFIASQVGWEWKWPSF